MKVLEFTGFQPVEEVVKQLEHLLTRAREGQIVGFVTIIQDERRGSESFIAGRVGHLELLGMLSRLSHQHNCEMDCMAEEKEAP